MAEDATMTRLDDQIAWYDRKSQSSQLMFKTLKVATIVTAAAVSIISVFARPEFATRLTALLGAAVVIFEGIQQLNQYHSNWIGYRSTCESLKHEKFLFLATAGPYAAAVNARALLAERIESLVSQEHAKWASTQEQTPRMTATKP